MANHKVDSPAVRRIVYAPKHPMAGKNGYLSEARKVLYDKIGPGWHECHWCKKKVRWRIREGRGTESNMIVADHVDTDWKNNAPENLVAACQGCNGSRWHAVQDGEDYIVRTNGTRLRAVQRICEVCKTPFLAQPSDVAKGKGRSCSLSCARRLPRAARKKRAT